MLLMRAREKYGLSAGYTYPSGGLHGAWDIPTPVGVLLHIDVDAVVRDINDGVPNNSAGAVRWSGAPSNWVLLNVPYRSTGATILINHLSPGIPVKRGQALKAGDLFGISGNSGNSTGPHTHVATFMEHWSGSYRYQYLKNPELIIWEPSKVLARTPVVNPPENKEDEMVVIFIQHKGKRYVSYPFAGVKRHIKSPQQEKNLRNIVERSGGRVIEWSASKDVDDPDAFGMTIG